MVSRGQDTSASEPAKKRTGKEQSTLDTFPESKSTRMPGPSTQDPCLTLRSCVGDFLARLSPSLESARDLQTHEVTYALRSLGLLDPKNHAFSSLRTSPACSFTKKGIHIGESSSPWMTLGTMSRGKFFTGRIGFHRHAPVSTLSAVLEDPDKVPRKYFLSESAKRQMLEREAKKRKRRWGSGAKILSQL